MTTHAAAPEPEAPPADRLRATLGDHPLLAALALSIVLATITAAWPTIPSYDPFSWVVWGHEVTAAHISFYIGGGPSWKPLPFLFTTVYGLFGGLAPTLWVLTARAGGILGLLGAFRLAGLLCRRAALPREAGWIAGVLAAVALGLTTDWTYYFFRGTSETLLIGVALWSVERLIAGRHGQAWALAAAEGLMRPEAWPFMALYGLWMWYRVPGMRAWVILGLVAQPVGWFVPPWISTGQPLLAATHASSYNGHLGSNPFVTVVKRGLTLQAWPALAGAAAAVALAFRGEGDQLTVRLALGVAGWWIVVVAMTLVGYPGLQRFFLPAAALTCVLAGVGLVRLGALAADQLAPTRPGPVAVAVAVILAAACVPFLSSRISFARAQEPLAARAVTRVDELGAAIAALGGQRLILPCHSSVVTVNHSLQTALAWKLGTSLERVQTVLRRPGIAFVGPKDSIDGGPPPISSRLSTHRVLRRVGSWRIYQVYAPGPKPSCVGQ